MSERVFERAKKRHGAEGSLVRRSRALDEKAKHGMVHQ
jgi:hypothetical protein